METFRTAPVQPAWIFPDFVLLDLHAADGAIMRTPVWVVWLIHEVMAKGDLFESWLTNTTDGAVGRRAETAF